MSLVKDIKWIGTKPPPMSVKVQTVVGYADQGLNITNHTSGVGGSRDR